MTTRRYSHKHRGFTLIEVMVALTIIAISLSALLSTSGTQANSAGYLKQKTLAHWVAMNELTQLRVLQQLPDDGERKARLKWPALNGSGHVPLKKQNRQAHVK